MEPRVLGRTVVTVAFLLGALVTVTYRHARTLEALSTLEELRRRTSVAEAERIELDREIQVLTSRQRVVPAAREHLGMHTPEGDELVLLPTEGI